MSSFTPESLMPPAESLVFPPIEPLGKPGSSFFLNGYEADFLSEFPDFIEETWQSPRQELMDRILLSLQ